MLQSDVMGTWNIVCGCVVGTILIYNFLMFCHVFRLYHFFPSDQATDNLFMNVLHEVVLPSSWVVWLCVCVCVKRGWGWGGGVMV